MTRLGAALSLLLLSGCGSDGARSDGGVDARPPRDAGANDDPCQSDTTSAAAFVGCNGRPVGASPEDGSLGGACEGDDDCVDRCAPDAVGVLHCIQRCTPAATYVSTGECPNGSRCFTLGTTYAECFRDCESDDDCRPYELCDVDGSCVPQIVDAGPPSDAGLPDGGLPDGAPEGDGG